MYQRIVVLDSGTFYGHPSFQESLQGLGELEIYDFTDKSQVKDRIANANIVLTNKVVIGRDTIENSVLLKLICVTATGMNNIDLKAASEKGVIVKNAKGYSTDSVAQMTFAMAFQLTMNLKRHNDYAQSNYKNNHFFTHLSPSFSELKGKTWGIIGLGTIGKKVAEIATVFGCKAVYHSPSGMNLNTNYDHLTLSELLKESDYISIHTPLNEFTNNLLNYNNLKLCKSTCILINVARGGIVDEEGLSKALNEELIAGAATDVFSIEPILAENPLLSIKNKDRILLTPHIAWGSLEARQNLMNITRENIIEYLKTGR
ncbi:MAG: D-2-hydroxyacid dehydrogenase [Opitutaceae bacterium]|nr:D-2-hydroxyacid dehydrogenase [Cytophagales bacterium]